MIINTDAIVLKTFSYGETSLISRCFTKDKGKISFIIKGAKSKKNLISPYFQPLSFINIIYKENEKRELQIISKVSFVQIWTQIPLSLRKMSLSQSILEISDFTLEKNDRVKGAGSEKKGSEAGNQAVLDLLGVGEGADGVLGLMK